VVGSCRGWDAAGCYGSDDAVLEEPDGYLASLVSFSPVSFEQKLIII
jgi:hypothetical protein